MKTKQLIQITTIIAFLLVNVISRAQTIDRLPCIDKTFSIVVHIIKDSLGGNGTFYQASASDIKVGIQKSIDSLNAHFASICASFQVCEYTFIDNYFYLELPGGTFSELQVLKNVENRINIYYYKSGSYLVNGDITTVGNYGAIALSNTGVKTIVQAMGTYFGLLSTEGNLQEWVNGRNSSTAGDKITDTPADPFLASDNDPLIIDTVYSSETCLYIAMRKDENGQYYNPVLGNAMSGYHCLCNSPTAFTREQYKKMAKTYLSNPVAW